MYLSPVGGLLLNVANAGSTNPGCFPGLEPSITRPTKRTIERGPGSLRAMYHSQRASAGWPQHHHRVVGALFCRKLPKQGHDAPPQLGVFNSLERLRECQPIPRRQEGVLV